MMRRALPSSPRSSEDPVVPARLLPALALAALVPLVLAGCSVQDALQQQGGGTAASPAALQQAWRTPASEPDSGRTGRRPPSPTPSSGAGTGRW